MINVMTETPQSDLKSIDQLLNDREIKSNEEAEITESLQQKYGLDLFDGSNSNIGLSKYATDLFMTNSSIEGNIAKEQTESLFTDVNYHQSNISNQNTIQLYSVVWLLLCVVIALLIIAVLKKRRVHAANRRNSNSQPKLYY